MIDAHVHLEKGDYSVEWIKQFVAYAVKRNIDEIYFLEHTHIFKECRNLYNEMSVYNEYQKNWYQKKWEQARPLILTASDAHSPQNVGLYIKEMNDLIQSV